MEKCLIKGKTAAGLYNVKTNQIVARNHMLDKTDQDYTDNLAVLNVSTGDDNWYVVQ